VSNVFKKNIPIYILTLLFISSFISNNASALIYSEKAFVEQGLFYYSPEGTDVCSSSSSGGVIGAETLPKQTTDYLESIKFNDSVNSNKESYQQAEKQSSVPWQILAALHYRMANLDPGVSTLTGTALGGSTNNEGLTPGKDFVSDLVLAGNQLKTLTLSVYNISISKTKEFTTEQWGQALLAYNTGLLYKDNGKTYTESPFVINGLDSSHLGMSWTSVDILSGTDSLQVGALTAYQYLGGVFKNSSSAHACSGISSGSIIDTAKGFAHTYAVANGKSNEADATSEYLKVWTDNGKKTLISDCGGFVSIVMRLSGADSSFPISGTDVILSYFTNILSGNKKYSQVDYNSLLPGDILLSDNGGSRLSSSNAYSGHIMIYLGPTKGSDGAQYTAVDASLNQRVPSLRPNSSVSWMQNRVNSSAWRLVSE